MGKCGTTASKCPIGSPNHPWGKTKPPTDGSFTLYIKNMNDKRSCVHRYGGDYY